MVICTGGGGIPVIRTASGKFQGAEAVIDKDSAGALLAAQLGADLYLMLTDVESVYLNYGTPTQHPIRRAKASDLAAQSFAAGSMAPKIAAACHFAQTTSKPAASTGAQRTSVRVRREIGARIRYTRRDPYLWHSEAIWKFALVSRLRVIFEHRSAAYVST